MKILFLANKPPYPPVDGGTIATFGIMEALADLGHQITVLVMNTKKHHVTPYQIPEHIAAKITFHLVEVPADIKPIPALKNLFFSKLPYNAQRFISKPYAKKLNALLRAQQFDVIQLEGLYLCPYIELIKRCSKAIIAYRSHNVEYEIWERLMANSKGLRHVYLKVLHKRLKAFELAAINKYDLLLPITLRDGQVLSNLGNTKPVHVLPAGISRIVQQSNEPINTNDLFFIGALDWMPNQEGLLWFLDKCWPEINRRFAKTTLTIAGRSAPKWLEDKFSLPNVFYKGEVPDAYEFMHKHGVMIVPLFSGSGMRVKIIEALANRKPVVSTSVGCEGISLVNGKHILIGDTSNQFINALEQIFMQPDLAVDIANNSINFVSDNFSNKKLAESLADFYVKYK
ncbi:MAG TPA: glycosyltransferase family 4 protein [Prolixibacteraceae bacterium]|nr:glycosyltransferase family 4 protein [Prolixibacteraceae bacterium]